MRKPVPRRIRRGTLAAAPIGLKRAAPEGSPVSNVAVFVPAGIAAIVILRHDGAAETLASYDSIAALGGTLYAVTRVGRWYRDVKPRS